MTTPNTITCDDVACALDAVRAEHPEIGECVRAMYSSERTGWVRVELTNGTIYLSVEAVRDCDNTGHIAADQIERCYETAELVADDDESEDDESGEVGEN